MDFNVNEYVHVRLTPHGRAVYEANHAMLLASMGIPHAKLPYRAPEEDAEGWSKWQLWELMREFGPHTGQALEPCFATVIRIPVVAES
jgi:hypothetical protein